MLMKLTKGVHKQMLIQVKFAKVDKICKARNWEK